MRLPIGIQDFTKLREGNYVYVDKTMYMPQIIAGGAYFLSRPRRFGKSLLLSTLKAAFEGRKDLFKGLWLEDKHDFTPRPIIRLDFSRLDFLARTLEDALIDSFLQTAREYNTEIQAVTAKSAFESLILELSQRAKVVVLIDEYDKPLTDYILEPEKRKVHQATLKSVYGALKPLDSHLHLVFLTGVSKIGKLSLFSDLNNLEDISLNADYALCCGYTKQEIESKFPDYLKAVAFRFQFEVVDLMPFIAHWYNGYSWDGINRVYCPFSFLIFLSQKEFKSYWYETGTPTFLLELIRAAKINPLEFESLMVDSMSLVTTNIDDLEPIGLMFQTGYLTLKAVHSDPLMGVNYTLTYPNQEVRLAFSKGLLEEYTQNSGRSIGSFAVQLYQSLARLEWESVFLQVNTILAAVSYEIFPKQEIFANSLWHLILLSTGYRTQSQVQTSLGRMDTLLETATHFVVFELKIGGKAQTALRQARNSQYAAGLSGKPVVLVGVVFNLESKQISDWVIG